MLEDISLGDLKRVVQVADSAGFSSAARALGESPKQVSRRIAKVEANLALRLFHRSTRQLHITAEGALFVQAARDSLLRLGQVQEQLSHGPSGRVRVQVLSLVVQPVLRWVRQAMDTHPKLEIDLRIGDQVKDWTAEGIDLALSGVPPTQAGLVHRTLPCPAARLACTPDYAQRWGLPRSPAELREHSCLLFSSERVNRDWLLENSQGVAQRVQVGGRFSSADSRALRSAMLTGCGIGLRMPADRPTGLVDVLPDWHVPMPPLYLIFAPGRRTLTRVRVVAQALESILGQAVMSL